MNQVLPPDAERAKLYEAMSPQAAKFLLPDGSVVDFLSHYVVDGGKPDTPGGTGSFFESVETYDDLPEPAKDYKGKLYFVMEGSGGLLSALGAYKYPRGFYSPNADGEWEHVPLKINVSEDATTLLNITDWEEFREFADNIGEGDVLLYGGILYQNRTGAMTDTPPIDDTDNWIVYGKEKETVRLAAFSVGVEDGILHFYTTMTTR